jgi:hypothetical protein
MATSVLISPGASARVPPTAGVPSASTPNMRLVKVSATSSVPSARTETNVRRARISKDYMLLLLW